MSGVGAEPPAPARTSPTSPLFWSVRRELWENRSISIAPLAVAALFLVGFAIGTVRLPEKIREAAALDAIKQRAALSVPYDMAAGVIMLTAMLVAIFYCLDALYGERRDRSTLFWKSLPVSDRTTVLAKASIPIVLLPLLAFAVTLAMHILMLLLSSAVVAASGQGVALLWSAVSLPRRSLLLLYHLVMVHGVSYGPFYAWMLLVSAWARRAPLLWAFLPPLAIGYLEKIALGTTHFFGVLQDRLTGGAAAMPMAGTFVTDPMTHLTPLAFLSSPGLWAGLVLTALFLIAAARLRRSRGPI